MNMKPLKPLSLICLLVIAARISAASETLVPVQTIPLKGVDGKLDHLVADSDGGRLFVANKPNNTLDIVDLKTGQLVKQIVDQVKVSGVAYAADLDMIYVGNEGGVCNGFDGKDYRQVFSTLAPNADNVHYHSEIKQVYVGQGGQMSVLDAKTGERKATIDLPGDVHGFRIDKKAGKIYAVLTKENLVAVIDVITNRITERFPLTLSDGGSPIAQDSSNGVLFVGCPKKKPMVVVFDAKSGKEVASVAIPAGVDDIFFDSKRHRIYASCSDGCLTVIQQDGEKYEVITKLETPKNSRTCVWSKGKLYLAVPRQDGKDGPEIRVFQAEPAIE
jgi:DNA-binding beta-propeller fold protein YncE